MWLLAEACIFLRPCLPDLTHEMDVRPGTFQGPERPERIFYRGWEVEHHKPPHKFLSKGRK